MFVSCVQVVDIDPYGTAAPYLEAAMHAVDEGGLLCVTCTDMPVLCGIYPETCFAKYSSLSIRAEYCHELALRIVLSALHAHAARFGRVIHPLLALSVDFYVRLFVRVYSSANRVKAGASRIGHVLQCARCPHFSTRALGGVHKLDGRTHSARKGSSDLVDFRWLPFALPEATTAAAAAGADPSRCPECGGALHQAGPLWLGPLHDKAFVRQMLASLNAPPASDEHQEHQHQEEEAASDAVIARGSDAHACALGHFPSTLERMRGMLALALEELDVPLFYLQSGLCKAFRARQPPIAAIRCARSPSAPLLRVHSATLLFDVVCFIAAIRSLDVQICNIERWLPSVLRALPAAEHQDRRPVASRFSMRDTRCYKLSLFSLYTTNSHNDSYTIMTLVHYEHCTCELYHALCYNLSVSFTFPFTNFPRKMLFVLGHTSELGKSQSQAETCSRARRIARERAARTSVASGFVANFTLHPEANPRSKQLQLKRCVLNFGELLFSGAL